MTFKANLPKWRRRLTKAQLEHLAEVSATGRATLAGLKRNLAWQERNAVPCHICSDIARKLDI